MKWELCVENASLIGPRVSNGGYHNLIDRLECCYCRTKEVDLLSCESAPYGFPRARRRRERRSGIPNARVSTSLSLRPSTPGMQDSGVRLAYQSGTNHFYVEHIVPFSFFFNQASRTFLDRVARNCFANGCAILKIIFFHLFSSSFTIKS